MSERPLNWENRIKQGLFTEETFTTEMKQTVLEVVDLHQSYFSRQWKRLAGAMVLCIFSIILTVNWLHDNNMNKSASDLSDKMSMPVIFKSLIARDLELGQSILQADPDILPGLSNKYNPLKNKTNGQIMQIPLSDIQLIDKKQIDGFGMALHYTLKPDSVTLQETRMDYFGFTVNGSTQSETLYHYGTGHMYDQQMSVTRLFGQEVLKIEQPICRTDGESCVWYFNKNADGTVSSFLDLAAASYERDLDGDGKEEAIVATHKQNQIYIFKEQDGQLLWASLREVLKADLVDNIRYDNASGIFRIHSIGTGVDDAVRSYYYKDRPEMLVRVDSLN